MNDNKEQEKARLLTKHANENLITAFSSNDSNLHKKAADDLGEITMLQVRQNCVWEGILPKEKVDGSNLQVQINMPEEQVFLQPLQARSPGAMMVPFDTLTPTETIFAKFYPVFFSRVMTRNVVKDVEKCVNYANLGIDLQKQIADDMSFDVADAIDYAAFAGCVAPAVGAANTTNPRSGIKQNVTVAGGLTRLNLARACRHILRSSSKFAPKLMLINSIDTYEICGQLTRDQAGGDISQTVLQTGLQALGEVFGGIQVVATIKDEICPEGTVFIFAAPNQLGVFKYMQDFVMHVERKKSIWVEMFGFANVGSSIGNTNGVIKITFSAINDSLSS